MSRKESPPRPDPTRAFVALLVAAALLSLAGAASAQGLPSAALTGRVTHEGQPLPGVSVTAKSPALQGTRTAVTNANGDYVFPNLPPGDYTVTYEISSFSPVTRTTRLSASQQVTLDAALSLTAVTTQVEIVARPDAISESPQAATTYTSDLTNKLPVTRTLLAAVALAPGVNANGPNGAFTISGAQSFDNLFTVNGVVVTDNVRGTPYNLFIEDAIQETTTTTANVSAEYGRFTGGVVNAITKSGGNRFSGTFRTTFTNDAWTARSPAGEERVEDVVPTFEATLGGPVLTDRLWFFGAGRLANREFAGQTLFTNVSYATKDDEKRYEGKLTVTPFSNHALTASYIAVNQRRENDDELASAMDLAALTSRDLPQRLFSANYNGVLSSSFFVEAQGALRKFTFEGDGSQYTDIVRGTPIYDASRGFNIYNSPFFCAVCPGSDTKRDNENFLVKGTWFLSTKGLGSHTVAFGYDGFTGKQTNNGYQSGSSYQLVGTTSIFQNGDIFPVFDGQSYMATWLVTEPSLGTNVKTHSAFVNDSWRLNDRISFNLGVRWDKNAARDSRDFTTADDSAFSPRLAASWDVLGDGRVRLTGGFARYVGAIQDNYVDAASNRGQPALYLFAYGGDEINTDPTRPLVSREEAIRRFLSWYGITGPNQLPTNADETLFFARLPGLDTQIRGSLRSPHADEWNLGLSGSVGSKATYRVDAIRRTFKDFYGERADLTTGQVTDPFGQVYDLKLVENTDAFERTYTALQTQFSWRPAAGLGLGGSWTWSHTLGNHTGETSGSGPVRGTELSYPEYVDARWNNPRGDLGQDQRHRVRLYATYDLPLPKSVGTVTLSAIQAYDTGTPYAAVGPVDPSAYVTNPGYATPPTNVNYYFTPRNAFRTDSIARTDLALGYSFHLSSVELFVQPQVINVFGNDGAIAVDTTVLTAVNSASLQPFDPLRDTPVEGVHWRKARSFGTARSAADYQAPRTFRFSVGLRF